MVIMGYCPELGIERLHIRHSPANRALGVVILYGVNSFANVLMSSESPGCFNPVEISSPTGEILITTPFTLEVDYRAMLTSDTYQPTSSRTTPATLTPRTPSTRFV